MLHQPFDDQDLVHVSWNSERNCWEFEAGPIDGRSISATYYPADNRLPLVEQGWNGVRACVRWVRANERLARAYFAQTLFQPWLEGWYDEEIDQVTTPEEFRDKFQLGSICFLQDQNAQLLYNDGQLFGGHGFCLTVDPAGRFVSGPDMFG